MSDNQVRVDLEARVDGLKKGLGEAERELDKFKTHAASAGSEASAGMDAASLATSRLVLGLGAVAGAAALGASAWVAFNAAQVAAALAIKDTADETGKLSQRLGIPTQQISELRYIADLSNVSLNELTSGMKNLANQMQSALSGNKQAIALFDSMGMSLTDASGKVKSLDTVFGEVADRMSGYADGASKTALVNDVLGRGVGEKLIPAMNGGAAGLRDMAKEAHQLGVVYDEQLIRQSQELNDNLTRLRTAVEGAKIAFGNEMMPALVDITWWMTESAKQGKILEGVLLGIGAAVTKAFGGEINPLKVTEQSASEKFTELAEEAAKLQKLEDEARNRSREPSLINLITNDYAQGQLESQRTKVAALRRELDALLRQRDKLSAPPSGTEAPKPDAPVPPRSSGSNKISDLDRMLARGDKNQLDDFYKYGGDDDAATFSEDAIRKAEERTLKIEEKEKAAHQRAWEQYEKSAARASERAAEKQEREFQRVADDINRSLTDAIMDGGASGADLLEQYFKTLVLRPVISAVMDPITKEWAGVASAASSGITDWLRGAMSAGYGDTAGLAAGVPQYAVGTPYVPEDGLAYLHKGEAVIPAEYNRPGASNVRIEVVNQSQSPIRVANAQSGFDAQGMFVKLFVADMRDNGPASQALANTFGLRR